MEKLLVAADVLLIVWLKNWVLLPSSLLAVTSIFTPPGGMVDVMVTVRSKGPSEGNCTDPAGGLRITARLTSFVPPPPLFFLQPEEISRELKKIIRTLRKAKFIDRLI